MAQEVTLTGTYAREGFGAALLRHSPLRWRDASSALRAARADRARRREWRIVLDDSEEAAQLREYLGRDLQPGEWIDFF